MIIEATYPDELSNCLYAKQYEQYRVLYLKAPVINSGFNLTNTEAFEYCMRRKFFVIIAPYNKSHEILAERTFAEEKIKWSLIGGSLKIQSSETFLEAANRLAQHALPAIRISDIEPFAFLVNTFAFENKECVHYGIAFTGRVRSNEPEKLLLTGERTRGHFVPNTLLPDEIAVSHNRKVFVEALKHVSKKAYGEAHFMNEKSRSTNNTKTATLYTISSSNRFSTSPPSSMENIQLKNTNILKSLFSLKIEQQH